MKILIAASIFPPDIGGPATYTEKLAQQLKEHSIEVAVIAYSDESSKRESQNSKLQRWPRLRPERKSRQVKSQKYEKYNFPVIRISRRYPKLIRHFLYFCQALKAAKGVDIIYAQNQFSAGIPALLAAKLLGKKFLVKIVGDYVWERFGNPDQTPDDFQKNKQNWKVKFLRKLQAGLARASDKIIVPSHYLKKLVEGWQVPSEKIVVVYNAAPDFSEMPSKEEAKRELGLGGEVLLSVGRLVTWKGFAALIEIMPELLSEIPDVQLLIIGEGPEKENLEAKIKTLNLERKVKLIGRVGRQEMSLYFKAADIFVLNTNYEGFSHCLLEAMRNGAAIITTPVGGNTELIETNKNGILVDYNNKSQLKEAIIRLSRDKSTKERLIKNSQERVKEFNWSRLLTQTLKIFYSLKAV